MKDQDEKEAALGKIDDFQGIRGRLDALVETWGTPAFEFAAGGLTKFWALRTGARDDITVKQPPILTAKQILEEVRSAAAACWERKNYVGQAALQMIEISILAHGGEEVK